jgi:hypothetical protein
MVVEVDGGDGALVVVVVGGYVATEPLADCKAVLVGDDVAAFVFWVREPPHEANSNAAIDIAKTPANFLAMALL